MQIIGKDFMAWFDGWQHGEYYWEHDRSLEGGEDPLHDDDGNWKLDPETVYEVDDLGFIDKNDHALPDVDTYAVLTRWLQRKGLDRVIVLVARDEVKTAEVIVKSFKGKVLKPKAPAGQFTGLDFMDWWDRAFPEGYYFDEDGDDLHEEDGTWKLDPEAFYDVERMGALLRIDDPESGLDIVSTVRSFMKARTEVPMMVLVAPRHVPAIKALGTEPLAASIPPASVPSPSIS
jgi:hypothetical protein